MEALRRVTAGHARRRLDLAALTLGAIEARYPGDWAEATRGDAHQAAADVTLALDAVIDDLARRGLTTPPPSG